MVIERNHRILAEIVTVGQKNGEIRSDIEADHLSTIVIGTLRLFVKKWQFANYSYSLPAEGEKLIKSIKLMIQK